MFPEIEYKAPARVADVIASLGRTEDVCFSPSNRRLAVAEFFRHRIAVFDVDITSAPGGTQVALTGGVELSSPALQLPHGMRFIDDDTLIVTSRGSDVALFTSPSGESDVPCQEVLPIARWPANETTLWNAPGSVAVTRAEKSVCEVLICNNGAHTVTRHVLDRDAGGLIRHGAVLLRKYLDVPDGVTMSADGRWLAVSNHSTHNVLLYENSPALNAEADPAGILRGVYFPHGLRFSADGRRLFVADAGAPYLHVYGREPDGWRGVRHPLATVRIMDDALFRQGQHNLEEGGPKGLDIDAGYNVLVVTSECQPLAFFDLSALLQHASTGATAPDQRTLNVTYELTQMRASLQLAKQARAADVLRNSLSWRMTAPLRRLNAIVRRRVTR